MPMIEYYAKKDPKTQAETLLTLPSGKPMPRPFCRIKDANGVETENNGNLIQATHINANGELVKSSYTENERLGRTDEQARAAEAHELRGELVIAKRDFTAEFEKRQKEKAQTATTATSASVTASQPASNQPSDICAVVSNLHPYKPGPFHDYSKHTAQYVKINIDATSAANTTPPKPQMPPITSQLSTDGLPNLPSVAQQPASTATPSVLKQYCHVCKEEVAPFRAWYLPIETTATTATTATTSTHETMSIGTDQPKPTAQQIAQLIESQREKNKVAKK